MPLVLASLQRRMNLGRPMKLAGVLLATALALTGCAPKWSSARIPTYEPMPVDVSGFPNAADKAKLAEIAGYMRERLVAHHVDAPHANTILWQFHYFAPVRYFDDDCSSYVDLMHGERFRNEGEQNERMGAAAKDVLDRYDRTIPHSQLGLGDMYNEEYDVEYIINNPSPDFMFPSSFPSSIEFRHPAFAEYVANISSSDKTDRDDLIEKIHDMNRRYHDDVVDEKFNLFPRWRSNFHLRNLILDIYISSIYTNEVTINGHLYERPPNRGKNHILGLIHKYQNGSNKQICKQRRKPDSARPQDTTAASRAITRRRAFA